MTSGETIVFRISDIGFWNPSLITFSGNTDNGRPVHLIQHVSQISVLIVKLPRKDLSKPKRPVGLSSDCQVAVHLDVNANLHRVLAVTRVEMCFPLPSV